MVYTILITIVFIAELIIMITIIQNLLRLDRVLSELNNSIMTAKPTIKDICELTRKISEQCEYLAKDFVYKTKKNSEDLLLRQISKTMISLLIVSFNFKIINKLRKSKITKTLIKGLSLLENMI